MRHYAYLDHIRWMTVLLVIVYHVCYLFNGVGIFGGVPNARNRAESAADAAFHRYQWGCSFPVAFSPY